MYKDKNGNATEDIQNAVDSNVSLQDLKEKKWELLYEFLNDDAFTCLSPILEDESCMNTVVTAIQMAMTGNTETTYQAMISVIDALLAYHQNIEDVAYEILEAG